jgi:chromosome partition protein MukE
MTRPGYAQLQDVLLDADFPELDLALRSGRHVDRDDAAWYALLTDAQDHLEPFYRRYGAELIHKADGYFYLLPVGDKLARRTLGAGEMLVGQALALLYLDPAAVERGGVITLEEVVAQLVAVLGSDALIAEFNPKRKKHDERIAQKNVRTRVGEAARRLAGLGFVEALAGEQLRLRASLLRFAEPVRGLSAPAEALARLVAQGEVALASEGEGESEGESEGEGEGESERESESEGEGESESEGEGEGRRERERALGEVGREVAAPVVGPRVIERAEADLDAFDAELGGDDDLDDDGSME